MTQKERVIQYINTFGSISPMEAFMDLGVTKLATIISDMRLKDHTIVYQQFIPTRNRYDEQCHYMRYWLSKEQFLKDTEIEKEQPQRKQDPMEVLFYKED